ncbi:peptidoglycan DD-metalloendopeptidase family protein [Ferribacterium limneticum]|uniref:peptidoglycan DD-metalloendopeptidase family protein n=1 Tax=Ferribacterium limneticum TaxID=76259 RepID=UPI001CF7FF65|nr:peptidoglycan DD-metalloendopeptidase family protein [Ferribacterium limneticum]UCV24631.1 peptidoglycan DD-metalloendopeptidase family protein [Ferribacterium limneticum]
MIRIVAAIFPVLFLAGCISQQPVPAVDRSTSRAAVQPAGPGYYTVKRGDTLYRIALEHGQDHRDVANWNNIANPSSIKEGQILRVAPPGAAAEPVADGAVTKPIDVGSAVESRSLDQSAGATVAVAPQNGALKREPRVGKEPYSDEAYARLNKAGGETAKPIEAKPEVKPETAPAVATGPDDVPWMWPTSAKLSAPYSDTGNKGLDFAGRSGDPVLAAGDGKVVYAGSGLRGFGELVIVKHNATYLSAYAHNRKILVKEGQQVSRGQKIAEMGNTDADSVKLHFEIRKQGKPVDPAQYLPKR